MQETHITVQGKVVESIERLTPAYVRKWFTALEADLESSLRLSCKQTTKNALENVLTQVRRELQRL